MTDHTVEQGEHLSSITFRYGFNDFHIIWDHPRNAELKEKRQNPNVLLPGDKLFIPDHEDKKVPAQTGKWHRYVVPMPKLKIRLRLLNLVGKPIIDTPCELEIEGQTFALTTDGDGRIEQDISANAKQGRLKIEELEYDLRIGHLDPVVEPTGLHARLNNLGYYVNSIDEVDPELSHFALELFQAEHGLEITGNTDDETFTERLRDIYGC